MNEIRAKHMFYRCNFMFLMCGLSLYTSLYYSIFDIPLKNTIDKPYYINCIFFIVYLLWDTYKMLLSNDRVILYRKDLLIHHCVSIILYTSTIQYASLTGSNVLIMESISTLNYILREQKWATKLNYYRLGCIVFIRVPICIYYYFYYYPYFLFKSREYIEDIALKKYIWYVQQTFIFFFLYDVYLLKQISRNLFKKRT